MLALAKVTKDDVFYDLGSGDGRIPITAAQKFGTRGVGIDMGEWKPDRVVQTQEGSTIYLWTIPKEIPANLR